MMSSFRVLSGCHALTKAGLRGATTVTGNRCQHRRGLATGGVPDDVIGFIGLGNMGSGMAKNLVDKGRKVVGFDAAGPGQANLTETIGDKFEWASCPAEVASKAKVVVSMLPNNEIVKKVYTGDDGVLSEVQEEALLIDCSTIDPQVAKDMAATALKAKKAVFCDAPVSGGVNAAKAGTLTFMVGAEKAEDFEKAKTYLEEMGKTIYHCGSVGTGQSVKICNNMLLAISMIGVSESMSLGISLGLDPKLLADILGSSTGRCWSVDTYNPVPGVFPGVPSSNKYQGGFGSQLMLKDLGLAQDAATRTGSATPLGSQALHTYRIMCNSGYAPLDFSSVFQFLTKDENKGKDYF